MSRRVLAVGLLVIAVLTLACRAAAPTPTPTPTPRPALPTPIPSPEVPSPTPAPSPTPGPTPADLVALGKSLAARNGCLACHSVDGSARVGPTWKGLYGKEETLADGSKVTVDEEYLRESIVDPDAKIVKGFPPGVMPRDFGARLSEEEIRAIIEYIKTIK